MAKGLCFFVPRKRAFLVKTVAGAILFWLIIFLYLGRTSKEASNSSKDADIRASFPHLNAPPPGEGKNQGIDLRDVNKRDVNFDDFNHHDPRQNVRTTMKLGERQSNRKDSIESDRNAAESRPKRNNGVETGGNKHVTFFPPPKESWYKSHPMDGKIPNLQQHRKNGQFNNPAREEEADPNSPGALGE